MSGCSCQVNAGRSPSRRWKSIRFRRRRRCRHRPRPRPRPHSRPRPRPRPHSRHRRRRSPGTRRAARGHAPTTALSTTTLPKWLRRQSTTRKRTTDTASPRASSLCQPRGSRSSRQSPAAMGLATPSCSKSPSWSCWMRRGWPTTSRTRDSLQRRATPLSRPRRGLCSTASRTYLRPRHRVQHKPLTPRTAPHPGPHPNPNSNPIVLIPDAVRSSSHNRPRRSLCKPH